MRFHYLYALNVGFGLAAAQTTTTSSSSSSSTSLPELVAQLPICAVGCLPTVGTEVGCKTTDFECICSNLGSFVAHMGTCMIKHSCSGTDVSILLAGSSLTSKICDAINSNPSAAAIASASSLITAEIAQATASNAAVRMEHGVGIVGAAALAAFVF